MNSHRVIIVSFISPLQTGASFNMWPNHITVVPYFQTDSVEGLITSIKNTCASISAIPYVIGPKDYFGPEGNVEVNKIVPNKKLSDLHENLLAIAQENDPNMDTRYCRENYKPHITHNNEPLPRENESGLLQKIYLVENSSSTSENKRLQNKVVLAVVNLSTNSKTS